MEFLWGFYGWAIDRFGCKCRGNVDGGCQFRLRRKSFLGRSLEGRREAEGGGGRRSPVAQSAERPVGRRLNRGAEMLFSASASKLSIKK